MGLVKAWIAIDNAKEASIIIAIQKYQSGTFPNIRNAVESQRLAYSTFYGCFKGRQPWQRTHELDQTLSHIEEWVVVKQIEDMDRRGTMSCLPQLRQQLQMVYTFLLWLFIRNNHSFCNGISILMRSTMILFFQFHLKGVPALGVKYLSYYLNLIHESGMYFNAEVKDY